MSVIDVESIQSYVIDRDDYIVGYSSDKNSKNPPLITTTGIIIYREESEFEDSNDSDNNGFQGFKYRYHIQSHHKKITFFDKEAANEGIQATGEEQKKQEELNNLYSNEVTLTNSLIYIAYSNDRYSEFDRVFIKNLLKKKEAVTHGKINMATTKITPTASKLATVHRASNNMRAK